MLGVKITNIVSVVPVEDHVRATRWYENLLGREADVVPTEDVAEWQLADRAWLQVGKDPERAGSTTIVIGVDDIHVLNAASAEAGLPVGEIVEVPGVVKMAEVLDPDGNKVVFVQEMSAAT